jgi:hypothetical protein
MADTFFIHSGATEIKKSILVDDYVSSAVTYIESYYLNSSNHKNLQINWGGEKSNKRLFLTTLKDYLDYELSMIKINKK